MSSAEFRETVLEYPRYFGKKNGENDQFYVTQIFIENPLLPFYEQFYEESAVIKIIRPLLRAKLIILSPLR